MFILNYGVTRCEVSDYVDLQRNDERKAFRWTCELAPRFFPTTCGYTKQHLKNQVSASSCWEIYLEQAIVPFRIGSPSPKQPYFVLEHIPWHESCIFRRNPYQFGWYAELDGDYLLGMMMNDVHKNRNNDRGERLYPWLHLWFQIWSPYLMKNTESQWPQNRCFPKSEIHYLIIFLQIIYVSNFYQNMVRRTMNILHDSRNKCGHAHQCMIYTTIEFERSVKSLGFLWKYCL